MKIDSGIAGGLYAGFSHRQIARVIGGFFRMPVAYAHFKTYVKENVSKDVSEIDGLYNEILKSISIVSAEIGDFESDGNRRLSGYNTTYNKYLRYLLRNSTFDATRIEMLELDFIHKIKRDGSVEELGYRNRSYYYFSDWTQYMYDSILEDEDGLTSDFSIKELGSIIKNSKKLHSLLEEQGWV